MHDYTRHMLYFGGVGELDARRKTDLVFLDEMLIQSSLIFWEYRKKHGLREAIHEYIVLIKRSFIYYQGVRGVLGTLYYWLGKVF